MNHFIAFIYPLIGIAMSLFLLGTAQPVYAEYVPDIITSDGPTDTTGAGSR